MSRWSRPRTLGLLALVGVVVAVGGFVVRRGLRPWAWDAIAARPMTEEERLEADRCGDPGFWTLIKLLSTDRDTPCGEVWLVRTIARHARGADQAAWLAERVVSPATSPGMRLRASLALAVAGRPTPIEPAWVRTTVAPERHEAMRAALLEPDLAVHLGPAAMALATAERVASGELPAGDALPALRWLVGVREPEADAAVLRAVEASTGLDEATFAELRSRRSRGLPVGRPPVPGRRGLAEQRCEGATCVGAALAAVVALDAELRGAEGRPTGDAPPADRVLDGFLRELGWSADERAAMAWQVDALRTWAGASEHRRRSLWTQRSEGPIRRLGWDRSGPPFAVAVVLDRLAPSGATFRSVRPDAVWTQVDGAWSARTCGVVGLEPPSADWPARAVYARAALELGGVRAGPLASRLDPLLARPEPRGDPVAHALGLALAPAAPLPGAEDDRSRVGADAAWCP